MTAPYLDDPAVPMQAAAEQMVRDSGLVPGAGDEPDAPVGADGLAEAEAASPPAPGDDDGDRLAVRWVSDALLHPPPEREVFVEGMLADGELCVVGAPRAIGKSWFGMNLAAMLDSGTGMFLGQLPVRAPASTLYCQGEIDETESSRRWQMLTGGAPPASVAETFTRWRVRTVKRRSSSSGGDTDGRWSTGEEWVDATLDGRLEATIGAHQFRVLVLDPWACYFAGNENSNDETEAALDKLRDLAIRYKLAIVILHHVGKASDGREPEDLWRGASRLADWASTRITLLPHYTERQAADQGMTRQQARRYADVKFLRRSAPTDDFAVHLDPATGWWERWHPAEELAGERRTHLDVADLVAAIRSAGGSWSSTSAAATGLGVADSTARHLLAAAARQGAIETYPGPRGAKGWRVPGQHLHVVQDTP